MVDRIVVHKLNEMGLSVWRYEGQILETTPTSVTLEARFDREKVEFHGITLENGDRFVETFHTDLWYNTFAIFDADDNHFKGWYCNITRPARIESGHIYADDLALDLLVYPDGRWLVLDEDEFDQLTLTQEDRECARDALHSLIGFAQSKEGPFHSLANDES